MPAGAQAKSDFLKKFENRLSVVGRDGSVTKVGEPGSSAAVGNSVSSQASLGQVDESGEEMGAITRMHPALANALLGDVSASASLEFNPPSPSKHPALALM